MFCFVVVVVVVVVVAAVVVVVEFTKEVLSKTFLSLKNANYYSQVLYDMSLKPFTGNFAKVSKNYL